MSDHRDARFAACHSAARAWLERHLGVDLSRGGVARSVERHVSERLAADGCLTSEAYARSLEEPQSRVARSLLLASTVTHSWLFRDAPQLEDLRRVLVARDRRRLFVWVAGCASGEEAYTIAAIATSVGHDVHVLGTDVNEEALDRAAKGVYGAWSARDVPAWARTCLRPDGEGGVRASDELRAHVSFARHSLMSEPPLAPAASGWDLILCRNVLIYFDRGRALRIASRLALALAHGGLLVLGASDVLPETPATLAAACDGSRQLLRRGQPSALAAPPLRRHIELVEAAVLRPAPVSIGALPQSSSTARPSAVEPVPSFDDLLAGALLRTDADAADSEAHAAAGMLLHARGEHQRAIEHLRAAACLEPTAWSVWLFLGLSSERLGWWPEARRAFRRALAERERGVALPHAPEAIAAELRASRRQLFELAEQRIVTLDLMCQGAFRAW